MEREFVPFDLAVRLKELGFDEGCFGTYLWEVLEIGSDIPNDEYFTRAPLWQQAFDWFRENFNLLSCIGFQNDYKYSYEIYDIKKKDCVDYVDKIETYEEARQSCLEKLIELVENETIQN